jgi:hypothetical protein
MFLIKNQKYVQGISRVTELKMQPTTFLQSFARPYPGLPCKCIVGCIFNSVGLIIIREIPCIRNIFLLCCHSGETCTFRVLYNHFNKISE